MTKITIKDNSTMIYILSKGHAGYAEYGSDIVCSAVSCLMYSYYFAIEGLNGSARMETADGYCKITFAGRDIDDARTMLSVIVAGVYALAKAYPDNVQYEFPDFEENPL